MFFHRLSLRAVARRLPVAVVVWNAAVYHNLSNTDDCKMSFPNLRHLSPLNAENDVGKYCKDKKYVLWNVYVCPMLLHPEYLTCNCNDLELGQFKVVQGQSS